MRTDRVENASVEFDVNTLRPTYRLLIGVPGKSNAFLISSRLGLPDYIIDRSKKLISQDTMKFEDLIENLQEKSIQAKNDAQKSESIKRELEIKEKELNERLKRLDEIKDRQLEEAKREARSLLRDIKEEADIILKNIRNIENGKYSGNSRQELELNRQRLRDTLNKIDNLGSKNEDSSIQKTKKLNPKDFKVGMEVFHTKLNQSVNILTNPDKNNDVQVQAGIMKLNANISDLTIKKETKQEKKIKKREVNLNLKSVSSSINLRGLDAQEALYRVDMYLDEAALAGLHQVTIIHGVGTGVLKREIQDMLKRHPHAKKSRAGEYGEGGMGVTIVEVK